MPRRPTRQPAAPALRPAPDHDTACEKGGRSPDGFVDSPGPGRSPAETAWRWCRAARRKDIAAAEALLAPDVILYSPMTDSFRYDGRTEVASLLAVVFGTVDHIDYHTDVGEGATRLVAYHGCTRGVEFEEMLVLSFDEQHRVCHMVVAIRGMVGVVGFMSSLAPRLLAANHSRLSSRLARVGLFVATRAVIAMDRWIVPLAEPVRDRG